MRIAMLVAVLSVFCGSLLGLHQSQKENFLIIDMALSSPEDDPEPYLVDYIQNKEHAEVKKIRILNAPDTQDLYYTGYVVSANNQCRDLWLVRISIAGKTAQGSANVLSCEKAENAGLLQKGKIPKTLTYSPSYWPARVR